MTKQRYNRQIQSVKRKTQPPYKVFCVCVQHAPIDAMVSVTATHFNYNGMEACGYKWLVSNLFDVYQNNIRLL